MSEPSVQITSLSLQKILIGHVIDKLKDIPDESVHCVITSPPYWGLRDYQLPPLIWPNGQKLCKEHEWGEKIPRAGNRTSDTNPGPLQSSATQNRNLGTTNFCLTCNAWRGSLGLEPTPELYVQHIVEIFREVRRVLRKDGTLWLNMGDSYAAGSSNGRFGPNSSVSKGSKARSSDERVYVHYPPPGLKPKDLCMMPARMAMALQADGWYLRSDIIWSKPNPMPESITDRPTKSHEYIFLLIKSKNYFYDQDAVRENSSGTSHTPASPSHGQKTLMNKKDSMVSGHGWADAAIPYRPSRRNLRSVWPIATKPFSGAHFATFPPEIPERCIKAGTSQKGCCPKCGSPWERIVKSRLVYHQNVWNPKGGRIKMMGVQSQNRGVDGHVPGHNEVKTLSWQPTCKCGEKETSPCIVLDPFAGAGTTLEVAKRLGRDFIGIELSEKYIHELIEPRLKEVNPLFETANF